MKKSSPSVSYILYFFPGTFDARGGPFELAMEVPTHAQSVLPYMELYGSLNFIPIKFMLSLNFALWINIQ